MKRSGQHGFIEWLIHSRGGRCVHLNNVIDGKVSDAHLYTSEGKHGFVDHDMPCEWRTANIEDADLATPLPYASPVGLFLRDVYNCMASRLKVGRDMPVARWIQHAKEYLGDTNLLAGLDVLRMRYDVWRSVFAWPKVADYAWGSSWGDTEPGKAQLDRRWTEFRHHSQFRSQVMANDEAGELNERIFGWRLGTGGVA